MEHQLNERSDPDGHASLTAVPMPRREELLGDAAHELPYARGTGDEGPVSLEALIVLPQSVDDDRVRELRSDFFQ
jgi:hypothetical protein